MLRTGQPEFLAELTDEMLAEAVQGDEELAEIARDLGLRSMITVPLVARQRAHRRAYTRGRGDREAVHPG